MAVQQISSAQGRELDSNPGYVLRTDASKAWDRAIGDYGKDVLITGAWRSRETQERIFKERYRPGAHSPFGDYRAWPQYLGGDGRVWGRVTGAAAAVPGTSNHGGGVAVDVKTRREAGDPPYAEAVIFASWNDADRNRFLKVAKEHGWDDDEGRSVGELWHLTYYPDRDQHRGEPVKAKPEAPIYLKKGTRKADQVRKLQEFLKDAFPRQWGKLKVDGVYGNGTERVVKHWQTKAGLAPTGSIGPKSRDRLIELGVDL